MLAELEGELQAKDVAIAALKSECARGIANGMANPRFVHTMQINGVREKDRNKSEIGKL